jgi:type IV pilus assembly protein PilC
MLTYKYIARDASTGQKIKAEVQADNEQSASKLVRDQGLSPIDISVKGSSGIKLKFLNRVKAKDKVLFSRQLSTLINAGLPLVQSLRTVTNQTRNKTLKLAANQIITDVESGQALSVALAKHPAIFNQIFVSLVAAGETSGTLDKALERLASQQEKDAEIMSKVHGAMVYPLIVLLVMGAVWLRFCRKFKCSTRAYRATTSYQ